MTYNRKLVIALVSGFVLGVFWFITFRVLSYQDTRIHYHGNFALFVNGQREEFSSSTFYEETQACSADEIGPKSRVHLHNQKGHIVHVHDEGSTWGHLFANLGYGLNGKSVQTDEGVFVEGENGNELTFLLNGQEVENPSNEVIRSEDVLLINYGKDTEQVLQQRYDQIAKDAAEYNTKSDPSACAGSQPITFTDKLKAAIGIE